MKKIFLVLIGVFAFVGCSKEDDSSSSLSEIEQRLVGVWYPTTDYEDKWFTYNEDGTSIYHNSEKDYDGVWEVIDNNVLIEFYPDPDETVEGWQENPDLKHIIEFEDDFKIQRTDYNDNTLVTIMYKECELCPARAEEFQIYFNGEHQGQYGEYSLETTYYTDDVDGELNSEVVTSNLFSGDYYTLTAFDKVGFKYETNTESQASVELIEIKDSSGNIIFTKSDFSIGIGETFIYEISSDSYTVD
ncbi:hypothetical protein [Cellulophaga omnivescoria]|uniref:hypothetical protein n=1 Tax=Cellulophaga omnivescoria TaxID=1888890 RepID=UPI0022F02C5F|nr:hypothetical protein [Cellulophaga omnivescoria]WBU90960.1 hypothetical protein PBN93_08045 [Cellulophaga omnivescoria]